MSDHDDFEHYVESGQYDADFAEQEAEVEATFRDLERLTEFFEDRERARLVMWRLDLLETAGFTFLHASALAVVIDGDPWRQALDLANAGCEPEVAVRIAMP